MLLLWIIFVIYVSCLSCFLALWSRARKGIISWLSSVWYLILFCNIPVQCPGLGVVLECIDSWSPFLLYAFYVYFHIIRIFESSKSNLLSPYLDLTVFENLPWSYKIEGCSSIQMVFCTCDRQPSECKRIITDKNKQTEKTTTNINTHKIIRCRIYFIISRRNWE